MDEKKVTTPTFDRPFDRPSDVLIMLCMCDEQLDLFSSAAVAPEATLLAISPGRLDPGVAASVLDDHALIAAIPEAGLSDSVALACEAGRRRLAAAVPGLGA